MKVPSFRQWLLQQTRRDDPVGDIARDVKADDCWPRWGRSLHVYEAHLDEHGASDGAHEALERAFNEWRALKDVPHKDGQHGG